MKKTKFISFYSHKGGVGRSMALTNIAYLLVKEGKKVCIIDFDLEAPGQHHSDLFREFEIKSGLLELMQKYSEYYKDINAESFEWDFNEYSIYSDTLDKLYQNKQLENQPSSLYLIPSGNMKKEYHQLLSNLNWKEFYDNGGADFFNALKARLMLEGFDYVLTDSRTGFSDIFYISTLSMSDTVVLFAGLNRQNIDGIKEAYNIITSSQVKENYGSKNMVLVNTPLPQIDSKTLSIRDDEIKQKWEGFDKWDVRLPYLSHLALRESVSAYDMDRFNSNDDTYYQKIVELKNILLEEKFKQNTITKENIPTNPFDVYRADYQDITDGIKYYVDPADIIQDDMKSFTPTLIYGPRGSGKTMLAKMLSYEAEIVRKQNSTNPDNFNYFGLYFRVDVDILRTFDTNEDKRKDEFNRLFGQYFDLLIFRKAIKALNNIGGLDYWIKDIDKFGKIIFREVGKKYTSSKDIYSAFEDLIEDNFFEIRSCLNNPTSANKPYNIQPNILIKLLVEHLNKTNKFQNKYFIVCVDEYENFRDYQQIVINTRLKQTKKSDCITYKLLMKDMGLHTNDTCALGQPIQSIHDYTSHNLTDFDYKYFYTYAKDIVNKHLEKNPYFRQKGYIDIDDILQSISIEEETNSIGGRRNVLQSWLQNNYSKEIVDKFDNWFKSEKNILRQTVGVILLNQGKSCDEIIEAFSQNNQKAKDWYHNYHRGGLFWLYTLKNVTKKYAGFNSIVGLSGFNIRTILELCSTIIQEWLSDKKYSLPISFEFQAKIIASKSREYKDLLKTEQEFSKEIDNLIERLGRVFEAIHKSPRQSEPEINHFAIKDDLSPKVKEILKKSYMITALIRLQENKQKNSKDTRGYAWQLHPRFAAHYGISTRKKKQISFSNNDLETLIYGNNKDWGKFIKNIENRYTKLASDTKDEGTLFD